MNLSIKFLSCLIAFFVAGCATTDNYPPAGYTRFNQYEIEIISEPPGARIEWNNQFLGFTPLTQVLHGDYSHSGGYVKVVAHPKEPGRATDIKILKYEEMPNTIYFDMR